MAAIDEVKQQKQNIIKVLVVRLPLGHQTSEGIRKINTLGRQFKYSLAIA